jgi:hypothetical protein
VISRRDLTLLFAGFGAGALGARSSVLRTFSMSGTSIAAPDAVGWVTDFLNASYFARPPAARSLEDLRLAWAILTTRWHRSRHRRLHAHDVLAFNRAFGRRRLAGSPFATLDREALLAGAGELLGEWFPEAWSDGRRRGWGIVFEDEAERAAFRPERRLAKAPLRRLTPPVAAPEEQVWHTYDAVPARSADATCAALLDPPRWPDFGSALGRFTPLRSTGLGGQTFEIEILLRPLQRAPLLVRAYVTATKVLTRERPDELAAFAAHLDERLAAREDQRARALPPGAEALAAVELTTHDGHFIGAARSNIVLFEENGQAFVRDVGQWDPMPWHVRLAYRQAGARAQEAFWGGGSTAESMLRAFAAA